MLSRSLGGLTVIRKPSGEMLTVRATAHLLWLALEFESTPTELIADIEVATGASCADDVRVALTTFRELDLLETAPTAGTSH